MGAQRTFAGLAWSQKKKVTRRERFLAEMNAVIPWTDLGTVIAPHYPTARPPADAVGDDAADLLPPAVV